MRLPWGRLTRKMPRATATDADVVLARTCGPDGSFADWFVAPAIVAAWNEPTERLSPTVRTRKEALDLAWSLSGKRGGRLLDHQRGTLAEQPIRWSVELVADEQTWGAYHGFEKGSAPRRWLMAAIQTWSGMTPQDARWSVRQIMEGHRRATLPLTQTETVIALGPRAPMRPKVAAVFDLLLFGQVDVLPQHLSRLRYAACSSASTGTCAVPCGPSKTPGRACLSNTVPASCSWTCASRSRRRRASG